MNNNALENPNLITVMVPTYNRIDKLKRCVESIFNQTYNAFNLVISDNASTDGTKKYLDNFRDRPNVSINYSKTNVGLIKNLEKCIEMAKTEWVVFVADDDRCSPDFISEIMPVVSQTKSAIVLPGFDGRDLEGNLLYSHVPESVYLNPVEAMLKTLYRPTESLLKMLYQPQAERFSTAGIAGFAMRRNLIQEYLPMKNYPGGFYMDTFLVSGLTMLAGIETVNKLLYTRTEWAGSITSARHSYKNRRCAWKLFINDFRPLLLSKSVSWDSDKRDAVLDALQSYEKNSPFTIRKRICHIYNQICQIEAVRKVLKLRKQIRERLSFS